MVGHKGEPAILWSSGVDVTVQNYSSNHINTLIKQKEGKNIRFIGIYGHPKQNQRQATWDLIRRIEQRVKERWILGGDLNEVLDDSEKNGCRRKSRVTMDDFKKVIDDMVVVDIKLDKGWFMWTNNRRGQGLVRERLDRFFVSSAWLHEAPFLATEMVR